MKKVERTVNLDGWVEIPAKLRRALDIRPGTKVCLERVRGGIAMYPIETEGIERYHGILAGLGLPADIEREPDREIE